MSFWWTPGVSHARHCKPCYLAFPMFLSSVRIMNIKSKFLSTDLRKTGFCARAFECVPLKFLKRRLDDSLSIFVKGRKKESVRQIKHFTETSVTPAGRGGNSHSCFSDTWKLKYCIFTRGKYQHLSRGLSICVVVKSQCSHLILLISCTCRSEVT